MLKEMLRKLMDQFKIGAVGTPPSIQPEPPLMPQTITPQREMYQEGGELDAQMTDIMEEPTHTMPDGTEMPGATHEETQLPDEEMEEDHVEFIIAEALEPEEQQ